MQHKTTSLEIFRWGYVHLPGAVFFYADELNLDIEDIGVLAAIFYAFENTKPIHRSGVSTGQILHSCSTLTSHKLSRKLLKLTNQEVIEVAEGKTKAFTEKIVRLEPLMIKLEKLVRRDHPEITPPPQSAQTDSSKYDKLLEEYKARIEELEQKLGGEKTRKPPADNFTAADKNYKRVADFIAKKTGNLLSVKMENELSKWLVEFGFTPEFLLCMLELAFERKITNPRDITKIAKDLKAYSINNLDGLEVYFKNYVDHEKNITRSQFDPDAAEFGNFTGLDMSAEARRKVYNKWRYDWGFSHQMIMKAGELMCQRTKNGGMEYIDSVLNNWMTKEIRSLSDVEKEIAAFRTRAKSGKTITPVVKNSNGKLNAEYEFYVPPEVLADLKSKV